MEYRVRQRLWALSGREMISGQQRVFVHVVTARCFPAKRVQGWSWADLRHVVWSSSYLHLHGALTSTAGQDVQGLFVNNDDD